MEKKYPWVSIISTHANDSDTDDDGLQDGDEMINIPRPWQRPTNPTSQ